MNEYIVHIAAGNELAFRQFYLHYFDRLLRFANTFVPTAEEAEEVVSDVFLKVWLRREQLTGIQNIPTYLYTAVRNTSLNYLERAQNAHLRQSDPHIRLRHTVARPDEILMSKEAQRSVEKAINQLPTNCKLIFRLVREDGLRYREVAEILGISVNTVNAQMAIAAKKICASIPKKIFTSL